MSCKFASNHAEALGSQGQEAVRKLLCGSHLGSSVYVRGMRTGRAGQGQWTWRPVALTCCIKLSNC